MMLEADEHAMPGARGCAFLEGGHYSFEHLIEGMSLGVRGSRRRAPCRSRAWPPRPPNLSELNVTAHGAHAITGRLEDLPLLGDYGAAESEALGS